MEKLKVGFIGCGNMGGALAKATAKSGICDIYLTDTLYDKSQKLAEEINANATDMTNIAKECKYIFLGVKPQGMSDLLSSIADTLKARDDRFILVTMAAGIKISKFNEMLNAKMPIIRIMPNTPVAVGEGMILYSLCSAITESEENEFLKILEFSGKLDKLDEELIDAGCVISGCGPAFIYIFAESMAKAGVELGLEKENAVEYAAQTLFGAAKLMLTSGETPETLRKQVCSPKGSTIEGVTVLQNSTFDQNLSDALNASFKRTKELGK